MTAIVVVARRVPRRTCRTRCSTASSASCRRVDHFDYVRSFARQGYGGITLWMKGGSSKEELDCRLVPGAQEDR